MNISSKIFFILIFQLLALNAHAACVAPACSKVINNGPDANKKYWLFSVMDMIQPTKVNIETM